MFMEEEKLYEELLQLLLQQKAGSPELKPLTDPERAQNEHRLRRIESLLRRLMPSDG
jgi:hypothetical protein